MAKIQHRDTGLVLRAALLVLVMASVSIDAMAAAFVKFDGVDGESSAPGHEGWSDIFGVDWGLTLIQPAASAPFVEFSDLQWTQSMDVSFPKLAERMWKQFITPTAAVDLTVDIDGDDKTYFSMEFEHVQLTRLNVAGTSSDLEYATVEGAFNYGTIKVTYTRYLADGTSAGSTEASYDLGGGTGEAAEVALLFGQGLAGPTIVPVPAGVWLLASGLFTLGGVRWRRDKQPGHPAV